MLSWRNLAALVLGSAIAIGAGPAPAGEMQVAHTWVHSALAGQPRTDAYVDLHAQTGLRLIGASTPWAQRIELDDGSSATPQRTDPQSEMPATGDSRLAPAGYHLVLIGIGRDIANGDAVPITLELEDAGKVRHRILTFAEARGNMFPPGPPPPPLVR